DVGRRVVDVPLLGQLDELRGIVTLHNDHLREVAMHVWSFRQRVMVACNMPRGAVSAVPAGLCRPRQARERQESAGRASSRRSTLPRSLRGNSGTIVKRVGIL